MKRNYVFAFITIFLLSFVSVAYAAFNSELTITGEGVIQRDTVAPTCGAWYLRDSSLTIQQAYNQNKFINPGTNTTWTNTDKKLFIECSDNMAGDYGCINVTEITDSNNQKRYFKEVKEYTTSVQTDSNVITVTLKDAYLNERTCTLPVGGSNPYIDKSAPSDITITKTSYNKFTYSASDDMGIQGYMVTTTSTEPALDDANWVSTASEFTIDSNTPHTYYVWVKDGANISHQTISSFLLTKTEGTGTTLTLKYNNNSGVALSTGCVLEGTTVYVEGTLKTGYNTLDLRKNNVAINSATTHTINQTTTFTTSSPAATPTVTANSNGGTIASTSGWTGTGNTSTKIVTYGQTYGTLPTPTRTGYTFQGWSLLPEGYTQVEYIASTNGGGQYINTGITPNNNIAIEVDGYTNVSRSIYGTQSAINATGVTAGVMAFDYRTTSTRFNSNIVIGERHVFKQDRNKLYVDGNLIHEWADVTFSSPYQMFLFGRSSSEDGTLKDFGNTIIYRARIWSNGTLVRDFIPCIDDSTGKAGMYELVEGVFYGNAGQNDFSYGSSTYLTSSTIVSTTNNHTLTAIWEPNIYTITLDKNGGTGGTGNIYEKYGDGWYFDQECTQAITNIVTPTKTGYRFDGYILESTNAKWINADGTLVYSSTVTSNPNLVLKAKWIANTYTVNYNSNGGTGTMPSQIMTYGNSTALTTNAFTKTGYTFAGWNTSADGTGTNYADEQSVSNLVSTNNGSITLYAKWTANTYTVTANANGGTIASTSGWTGTGNTSTKSVTFDSTYGTLPTVSRSGYTFAGWNLLPEGYTQVEYIESTGTQYIETDYQLFNKNKHEILMDFMPTQFYNFNQLYGSTTDANTFEAWIYSNGNLHGRYNGSPYGNQNLLVVNTRYLVDFIKNDNYLLKYIDGELIEGGATNVSTSTATGVITLFKSGSDYSKYRLYRAKIYANNSLVLDLIPCINNSTGKAGLYDLVEGVFYENQGTGDDFSYGSTTYITASSVVTTSENHTLYAHWTPNTYTVTANANGGSIASSTGWTGTGNTSTKSVTFDSTYGTLPTVSRSGYTFAGWNGKNLFPGLTKGIGINSNTGLDGLNNKSATSDYIPVDFSTGNYYLSGLTDLLYSFVAVYDANHNYLGRTSGTKRTSILLDSTSIQAFQTFNVNDAKYIRITQYLSTGSVDGVDSLNIQLEKGNSATTYEPYIITDSTKVTTADNHTITAKWSANTYTVNYDANGGTGVMPSQIMVYGSTSNLSQNAFTRTGYTFAGWNTSSDGTGTNYTNGQSVSNLVSTNNGSITLYAKWTANTYTVTANANGGRIASSTGWTGTGNTATKSVTYDNTYGTLPTVSRTGWTFAKWDRNMLDLNDYIYNPSFTVARGTAVKGNNTLTLTSTGSDCYTNPYNGANAYKIYVKPSTTYTLSWEVDDPTVVLRMFIFHFASGGTSYVTTTSVQQAGITSLSFTTRSDAEYISLRFGLTNANNTVTFSNVQLEEGSARTTAVTNSITSSSTVSIANNHNIYAHWTPNTYTVTANANGGSIASSTGWTGTGNTSTKSVTFDSTYGTLPTVSRSGYTFAGWNGKNLINLYDLYSSNENLTVTGTNSINRTMTNPPSYSYARKDITDLLTVGKTYVLSYTTSDTTYGGINLDEYDGTTRTLASRNSITVLEGRTYYLKIYANCTNSAYTGTVNIDYSNVQLEEGTVSTEFEPYYISDSTTVTTANDHNIYAHWSPNPLTFNNKTVTSTYHPTTDQTITNGIDEASNGTGSYTYAITSGNSNNYFSLNGRNIVVAANTPANTSGYSVTIRATDSGSGVHADATYTIKVNKATNTLAVTASQTWSEAFATSAKTKGITTTNAGQGTLSYEITSQKDKDGTTVSYFSISGSNLSRAANTPVNKSNYTVKVNVTAAGNNNYNSATKEITYTVTVSKATPTVTTTVTGTAKWGETLTCSASNTGDGTSYNYQWYTTGTSGATSGTAITNATNNTYVIDKSYIGSYIGCAAYVAATANYDGASKGTAQTTKVAKRTLNVTTTNYNAAYDASAHGVKVKVNDSVWDGATIVSGTTTSYGQSVTTTGVYNTNYTLKPTYTNVQSSTTIYYKVTGGTYYEDYTGSGTVAITKKKATITLTDASKALTYPTAGSNTYTYDGSATPTCSSSNTAYVTCAVDATNHKITVTPVTPTSSAVTITVSASETSGSNYSSPDNKTFTVTVAKGTCPAPTNVGISSAGAVTWTSPSGATSSQISMAESSGFETATTGVDYKSSIIAGTGTRTVYVRSVCDTTYYSSANSDNATGTISVFTVSLTKGTGISAVSGAGNYINGSTAAISATVKTGYTWTNWTGTSTLTANSNNVTVNGNKSYTANATANTYTIAYTMNNGANPNPKPTSGTYDADVTIGTTSQPTKTITVTGNANGSGGSVGSAVATALTFQGWSSSTSAGLGTGAKTGASATPSTAWTGTKTTNKYFRNLRDTSGTVTLTANFSTTVNLPTVTRTGYTCKWYSSNTVSDANYIGESGGTWTSVPQNSATAITIYAGCSINTYNLTLNPNSGTYNGTTSNTVVSQEYGSTYSVPNTPTRTGYTFTGWALTGNGNYLYYDTSSTPTTTTVKNYDASNSTLPTAYNNKGNGTVTRAMVADSTATGGYSLNVVTNGVASPSAGGVYLDIFPTNGDRVNVLEIKAKIPTGYTINLGGVGASYTGYGSTWRSNDKAGNDEWKTYYLVVYTGTTGTVGQRAYIYLDGTDNTSVSWNIDSITMKSFTKEQFKSLYTYRAGDGTLTAQWSASGSKVTWDKQGGTFGNGTIGTKWTASASYFTYTQAYTSNKYAPYYISDSDFAFYKTGYAFDGWYTDATNGTQIFDASGQLKAGISGYSDANKKWQKYSNITLYARWVANDLIFDDQVITKTFSSTGQTANVTVATNGTGSYRYTKVSGESDITVSESGIITIPSGKTANTSGYTVVIRATDSNSGKTKDATYTIKINKAANPISVTAAQSGSVTFSTSTQDRTFTAASSGQGTVTYAIQSQKDKDNNTVSYFSIASGSNTTAKFVVAANTPVNKSTYTVVVRATAAGNDNYESGYKDITYTLTVSKATNTLAVTASQTWSEAFATSAKTKGITTTNAGQGTLSYEITSQKDKDGTTVSYFSISGSNLSRAANTPANKSNYIVKVNVTAAGNDNYNSATKEITYTVTVSKAANPISVTAAQSGSVTFSTSAQDRTFTAASSGQGTVTYAIQSQKDKDNNTVSYFSIASGSNTTAKFVVAANTPVNKSTYTVVVRATAAGNDNYESGYKDITYTLTVSKATCLMTVSNASMTTQDNLDLTTKTSNAVGTVSYTIKTNGTTTASTLSGTNNKTLTAGAMSNANDTAQTVVVTATEAATDNYNTCGKDITVTVNKITNTLAANSKTVYVSSVNNYADIIKTNNGGALTASVTSDGTTGGSNDTTNKKYTAGVLSSSNDNNGSVVLSVTSARTTTVAQKSVNVTLTVQKYTNALSWTSSTPANNTALAYGTSYTATATAATNGGTNGAITYSSGTTATMTINSTSGAITVKKADGSTSVITASMARTTTVKAASTTRTFGTKKGTLTATATALNGTYTGSAQYAKIKVTKSDWDGATIVSGTSTSYGQTVTSSGVYNTNYDLKPGYTNYQASTTIYYKISGGTYYNDLTGSTTAAIAQSSTTTTLGNITNTYNGNNQAATGATAKLANNTAISGAEFTYKYYSNSTCTSGETTTAPKNAGTYYVKATLTGTTNYATSTSNCATYVMNPNTVTVTYNYNNAYQISFGNGEIAETDYYIDWDNDFTISGIWKYPTAARSYLVIGNFDSGAKTLNIEANTSNKFRIYMSSGSTVVDTVSSTTIGRNVDITYTYTWVASTHTYTFTATGSSTNISMTGTVASMSGQATQPLRYGTRDHRTDSTPFTTTTYHKTLTITKVYTANGTNTLSNPATVSKPAYTYNGWFTAATGGNAVTNSTLVPGADTTYYAQWTPNTFNVKFNANGGSGTMSNQTYTFDIAQALTQNAFTREGYTFVGWSNNSNTGNTSAIYYDKQSVSNLSKTNGATVNLYALWISNKYVVSYNGNNSTSGSMSNQEMTYGTAGTLTNNAFARTGFTYSNWNTNILGTGTTYNNQASVNINANMLNNTSSPTSLATSSVSTGYAYSGRWGRTSTSITPTVINVTDAPSSLITKGFNIPNNTTSSNYYMYFQYLLVNYNVPYTISVYAKGSGNIILRAGNSTPYREQSFELTDTWTRYSMKVIPVSSNTAGEFNARTSARFLHNIGFGVPSGNGAIQVAGLKFETGETATEYVDTTNVLNLNAQWTANPITFNNKTVTSTYHATNVQTITNGIDLPSNGTGTYTYAITSGNSNNYFSLDGRNIKVAANTPANPTTGYSITIRATDSGSGQYADATYTIKVNKAACLMTVSNASMTTQDNLDLTTKTSNAVGTVSYTIKTNGTTTASTLSGTNNKTLTAGAMSNANDTAQTVVVTATEAATDNYNTCGKDITVTVNKITNTLAANSKTVYVSSVNNYADIIKTNNGGALTASVTSDGTTGGSNDTTNKKYTAGVLSSSNDNNGSVVLSVTSARTTTVAQKSVNVTLTVQKYTNALSWTSSTPANNTALAYGTSYTATATAATNGGTNGAITYSSGTTATMTINSTSGAITVKKADGSTSVITASMARTTTVKAASTTRTFGTQKGTCPVPTGLAVSNAGVVTWTSPSGATSSQISMAASSGFETATTGVDYNSAITESTGSRTVYVRSVCSTTYYTSANSDNASKAVTVYSVTLAKGTGISAVSGAGNYINGATAAISATVSSGYTWKNWTGTSTLTSNSNNVTVNGNKSYTANTTPNTYTIVFNANNGVGTMSNQSMTYGTAANLSTNLFSRSGYSFNGWNTKADGTGTSYTDGQSVNNLTTTANGTVNLFAKWSLRTYTLSYTLNNGTVSPANPTSYNVTTSTITLTNPTRGGYTFAGWTEQTASLNWNPGFVNTSGVIGPHASYPNSYYTDMIYLKANVTYSITNGPSDIRWRQFNSEGSYLGSASGASYKPPVDCYVRILYYNNPTTAQLTNTIVSGNVGTTATIPIGTTGNKTFTANWTAKTYTATFYYNSNPTSGSMTISSITADCTVSGNTDSCTINVPDAVTGSVGKYNSGYLGVATALSSMTSAGSTTVTTNQSRSYYAIYSGDVMIYKSTSTTVAAGTAYYRNEYISNITSGSEAMTAVLNTTQTATGNFTFVTGVSGYSLRGFKATANSASRDYASVAASATTDKTTLYAIVQKSITGTFYYYNGSAQTSTTASATQYIYCATTTTSAIYNSTYTVPTAVTGSLGPKGEAYGGVNTATGTATAITPKTNKTSFYAFYKGDGAAETVTATFYYSKDAAGTTASVTASGEQVNNYTSTTNGTTYSSTKNSTTSNSTLTPSLSPAEVVPTGTAVFGWASAHNTVTSDTVDTSHTVYYRTYKQALTIYYPTSTTAVSSSNSAIYRTAFLNTNSITVGTTKFTTVVAKSSAITTQLTNSGVTSSVLTSLYGTFSGLATSANTTTKYAINNAANVVNKAINTYYAVDTYTTSVTATFYYSSSNVGARTNSTASGTQTRNVYCQTTSAAKTNVNSNGEITAPSTTVPYGTSLVGWGTSASTLTTATVNTGNTKYYAIYSTSGIRINYYTGSAYGTRTDIYRLGVYGSNTNYTMYLSTSDTSLSNYATATGPGNSFWRGLSIDANKSVEYTSVGTYNTGAAYSSTAVFYTVYGFDVTYTKGSNVSAIGSTSAICSVGATSTSAGGTSCTVTLPTITANDGYTPVGWSTTNGDTSGTAVGQSYTITAHPTELFANATDVTGPTVTSLTITPLDGEFKAKVVATDAGSGMSKVQFAYKKCSDSSWTSLTEGTYTNLGNKDIYIPSNSTSSTSCLPTAWSSYHLRVIVKDVAGNSTTYYNTGTSGATTSLSSMTQFNLSAPTPSNITFSSTSSSCTSMQCMLEELDYISGLRTNSSLTATFAAGTTVNAKMKILSGTSGATYATENTNITSIQKSATAPTSANMQSGNVVSASGSGKPIYMWFSSGTIYYWSEAPAIYLNADSSYMFYKLKGVTTIDLSTLDASNVTTFKQTFAICHALTNLKLFKTPTISAQSFDHTFSECLALQYLDLSSINTANATNMDSMFIDCQALRYLDLTGFDTSKVTTMGYMFYNDAQLRTLDLSSFKTTTVTNMESMFRNCTALESIYVNSTNFSVTNVSTSTNMFLEATSIKGSNGTTYLASAVDKARAKVDGGNSNPGYFRAK